jgi:hypothetical protein
MKRYGVWTAGVMECADGNFYAVREVDIEMAKLHARIAELQADAPEPIKFVEVRVPDIQCAHGNAVCSYSCVGKSRGHCK